MPLIRKPRPDGAPPPTGEAAPSLGAASPEERWSAARGLRGQPGQTSQVAKALAKETDPRVREALFTALSQDGGAEAGAVLVSFIRHPDAAMRTGALDALAILPERVGDHIEQLLADQDADVRILSCDLVRALSAIQATALLVAVLERETAVNVCAAAVEVLSEVGDASALPALRACATRFSHETFLGFAIDMACHRIGDGSRTSSAGGS